MIHWTKNKYAEELKKGYWDLEPHFHYYSQFKLLSLFRTFCEEKMNIQDVKSAMYGEFVCEGKPIKKGFYNSMNFMSKFIDEICKKHIKKIK